MLRTNEAIIREVILHRVSSDDSSTMLSGSTLTTDEDNNEFLKKVFLQPFSSSYSSYEFDHPISLDYNVLFNIAKGIYNGDDFVERSVEIATHLKDCSQHPNINDGELYIVKFDDIEFDGRLHEALGVYKFEDKDTFIETSSKNKQINATFRKGIGAKKPNKGCLIIFNKEPFTIFIIDSNSNETEYWQMDFIKHRSKNDNINSTRNFLNLTKEYISNQLVADFEVSKTDQIDLLNRSVEYFKTHEKFNKKEFESEVFEDKNVIDSFRKYDKQFKKDNELEILENFEISAQAVKKQARNFKSILKLDKNFHIYIHGDRDKIEQGIDEYGRKFYKIFYDEEL